MRTGTNESWRLDLRSGEQPLIWALWLRAAEQIDVPDDDSVPGPLDIDVVPSPTDGTGPDLGRQWLQWWRRLLSVSQDDRRTEPDFLPTAGSGELQLIMRRRRPEAEDWRRSALPPEQPPREATFQAIQDVTSAFDQPLPPFAIDITTVPVRDDTVRTIGENRYLVADRLLSAPAWRAHLERMIRRAL